MRAMLALPIHRGCGRLLVALAFTGLAFPPWVATGRMAWAQKISPPPDTEIEQLFREYQRLTRLEPRRVEPVPGGRQTDWTSGHGETFGRRAIASNFLDARDSDERQPWWRRAGVTRHTRR